MSFECGNCVRKFRSDSAINNHCQSKGHVRRFGALWYQYPPQPSPPVKIRSGQYYCTVCNRHFINESGLKTHCSKSLKHRRLVAQNPDQIPGQQNQSIKTNVTCHFCNKTFKSPSALANHLESGKHGITRHHVTHAVRSLNFVPTITLPVPFTSLPPSGGRIETWTEVAGDDLSEWAEWAADYPRPPQPVEAGPPLREEEKVSTASVPGPTDLRLTPRGQATIPMFTTTEYIPADFMHLGVPYSCPLCHRTFRTIHSLTTHMNSATHDPNVFVCPNSKCNRKFTLVSSLMRHVESGTCGLATMQEVCQRFEELTSSFSRLLRAA